MYRPSVNSRAERRVMASAALAKLESARAVRDLAAIQLADTRVLAPASGIVSNCLTSSSRRKAGIPLR